MQQFIPFFYYNESNILLSCTITTTWKRFRHYNKKQKDVMSPIKDKKEKRKDVMCHPDSNVDRTDVFVRIVYIPT